MHEKDGLLYFLQFRIDRDQFRQQSVNVVRSPNRTTRLENKRLEIFLDCLVHVIDVMISG